MRALVHLTDLYFGRVRPIKSARGRKKGRRGDETSAIESLMLSVNSVPLIALIQPYYFLEGNFHETSAKLLGRESVLIHLDFRVWCIVCVCVCVCSKYTRCIIVNISSVCSLLCTRQKSGNQEKNQKGDAPGRGKSHSANCTYANQRLDSR